MKFIKIIMLTMLYIFFSNINSQAESNLKGVRYKNSADFICEIPNQNIDVTTQQDMLISFHNPNDFPVMLNNIVKLTDQNGVDAPELVDRYLNVLIDPKRNFKINCQYINDLFFANVKKDTNTSISFDVSMRSKSVRYLEIVMEYSNYSKNKQPLKISDGI